MSSKVAFSGISFTIDITDSLIVDIYSHLLFYNVFYILPCYLPLRAFSFKMNFESLTRHFLFDPPFSVDFLVSFISCYPFLSMEHILLLYLHIILQNTYYNIYHQSLRYRAKTFQYTKCKVVMLHIWLYSV